MLIVGAGPTGLVMGIELARRGVKCRLIDAADKPFSGSRGKGLQPRTLEIFDQIGVSGKITERAMLYPRMRVHVGPVSFRIGSLGTHHPATPELPWPNMVMLPQWRTEEALREHLAALGVTPEYGRALETVEQDETGVDARLARGDRIRAKWLVGCDGGRSTVRKALDFALLGETLDAKERVVADLEIAGLDRSEWHNWVTLDGIVAISPLPEEGLFQLQAPAGVDSDDALGGLQRATGYAPGRIHWKSRFRHQTRMAEQYRKARALLAGDAAHLHPPSGGQGLNTSVQDAWNLGWKLAAVLRGAPDALLDTYAEERMAVAAEMLKLTNKLHKASSTKRGASTNQLAVNYRSSSLSSGGSALGIMPGDRMPNLALEDGMRVFDRLKATTGGLQISCKTGVLIWVRPDGYVAGIGTDVSELLVTIQFEKCELEAQLRAAEGS